MSRSTERRHVEGDREQEIRDATLEVLAESGYDRLTMDAVATKAKASKATLYRRWSSKEGLVIDAVEHMRHAADLPDTGALRDDLQALSCGVGGLADTTTVSTFAGVLTALARDPDFAEAFRRDFVGPKVATSRQLWERAQERGEVHAAVDLDLFESALAGIVLHRMFVTGDVPDPHTIARVIDQIIMPAASGGPDTQHRLSNRVSVGDDQVPETK
ncbi:MULTISPECIES: TetR/AcrR family transcriptional regulator [unclassified Nocardioides]|uniref:TetR/AcrR family transcriptional regulator n=1 Tax=unclassified Nocardioides TaxID=2615069 RepID=UPI0009F05866|nr:MULTISPECIES: TetR/AcrR family transcriptional regulator [unclassified Nocardioides]GAW47981.1 Transcriptional regulator, TetR family [Nocardioides sp. PD653-B2]GAW53716.1 Transcriptional regulator, TetR family [Nocardioides sp. PD653]